MNIKSLLLGSAAAMVAVSSAQAADAGDAYGSGYFFIPGTETCIRFGGYVRSQYSKLTSEGQTSGADVETTQWSSRIQLDVDTRNETEWGTLRSLIRFRSNNADDDGSTTTAVNFGNATTNPSSNASGGSQFEVDQAFITIAGIRAGIGGSLFNANFAAGMNLQGVPQIFEDGIYGFSNSLVVDYTYAIDGLSISVGLEDNRNSIVEGVRTARGRDASDASFLAKVQYSADFGTVGIVGEFTEGTENDVYKAYATLDLSEFLPGGILGGYYMWQDDIDANNTSNGRLGGADNSWAVGLQMNLTDNLEFVGFYNDIDNDGRAPDEDLTTIALNWYPVSGLVVFGAYSFGNSIAGGGALAGNARGPFGNPATAASAGVPATFDANGLPLTNAVPSSVAGGGSFLAGEEVEFDQFLIGIRRNF